MPPAPRSKWPFLLAALVLAAGATLWLADPRVGRLWINTALLAAGAALLALPLGTLAAVLIEKTDAPGRHVAAMLFVGMLFIPLYLVAGAWDAGFGLQGWYTLATNSHLAREPWLAGWRSAIWIHGLAAVPWVVLIVGTGLRAVEAEIEEDAATCASPLRVLWHVTLRRAAPALAVAALWIAVIATAEISVTDFFQIRTFAEEVYTQSALGSFDVAFTAVSPVDPALPAGELRLAGLALGLTLSAALSLAAMLAASRFFANLADAAQRPRWICRLGPLRWIAAILLCAILLLVAGVPLINFVNKAGVIVSFDGNTPVRTWSAMKVLERVAAAPFEFRRDLALSAMLGAAAATAAVLLALPLAWRMRATATPWLTLALLAFCLIIPGPLLGIALIKLLNQSPSSPLAGLAWLYDTNFAPWLAQTIRALPLATLILWPAFASIPQATLDAAATEGAGWWGRLLRIALPQCWPAVAAAWFVSLAISIGELAATVLVVPPQIGMPISVRVFQLLHYGVDDRLAAICLVFIAAVAALTGIAALLLRRK